MANYDLVEAYLTASAEAADAAAVAEQRRSLRERNRLRAGVALLAVATVMSGGAATVAVSYFREADEQRAHAQSVSGKLAESGRKLSNQARQLKIRATELEEANATANRQKRIAEANLKQARKAEALAEAQRRLALANLADAREARELAERKSVELEFAVQRFEAADRARESAEQRGERAQAILRTSADRLEAGDVEGARQTMLQGLQNVVGQAETDDLAEGGQPAPAPRPPVAGEPDDADAGTGFAILSRLLRQGRPARMTRLPFYPGSELWEVEGDENDVRSFLLDSAGHVAVLAGRSDAIDSFNRINRPQLDTDQKVKDYVAFFGAHVWGSDGRGPLRFIQKPEQLPENIRSHFKPTVVAPPVDGKWRADTILLHNQNLFSVDMRVGSEGLLTIEGASVLARDDTAPTIVYHGDGARVAAQPAPGATALASVPPAIGSNWEEVDAAARDRLRSRIRKDAIESASSRGSDAPRMATLGEGVATGHLRTILAAYKPEPANSLSSNDAQTREILQPGDADTLARHFAAANDPARTARAREAYQRMQADFAERLAALREGGTGAEESVRALAAATRSYSTFAATIRDKDALAQIADGLGGLLERRGDAPRVGLWGQVRAESIAARAALADLEGRNDDWARLIGEGRELTVALAEIPDSSAELLRAAGSFARYYLNDNDLERRSRTIEQMCAWAERALADRPADTRGFAFIGVCASARIDLAKARNDFAAATHIAARLGERLDEQLARAPDDQILLAWKGFATLEKLRRLNDQSERAAADELRRDMLGFVERAFGDRPLEYASGFTHDELEEIQRVAQDDRERVVLNGRLYAILAPFALAFPRLEAAAHGATTAATGVATPIIAGDSQARRQAKAYIEAAVAIMDDSGLLAGNPSYSRRLFAQCNVYDELARYHEEGGNIERAGQAKTRLESICRPLVERLPAAVDVGMILVDSDYRFARLLDQKGRSREAVSFAERASAVGWQQATLLLADMARSGRGMGQDRSKAAALDALAARQDPGWLEIALTPDATRRPVGILFMDDLDGKHHASLDAQLDSFSQVEGWTVSPALANNLREIQHVARTTNVPFRSLARFYILRRGSFAAPTGNREAEFEKAQENVAVNPRISMDASGIAIGGFDPVALAEGSIREGKREAVAIFDGAIWMFENQAHRDLFVANPETYVPAFGGYCAGCLAIDHKVYGNALYFDRFEGKTYLFSSAGRRDEWRADRPAGMEAAARNWERLKDRPMQ